MKCYLLFLAIILFFTACNDMGVDPIQSVKNNKEDMVTISISIKNFSYEPDTLRVTTGTTVIWTNSDAMTHTVTSDNSSWDSGSILKNDSFSYMFMSTGVFPYHCAPHPFMRAVVIVTQ